MIYRGYEITKEKAPYGVVIWVVTPEGPCDVVTVAAARQAIDAIIEEKEQIAAYAAAKAGITVDGPMELTGSTDPREIGDGPGQPCGIPCDAQSSARSSPT